MRFCEANGIKARVEEGRVLQSEYVHPATIKSRWGNHSVYINNILPVVWQEQVLRRKTSIVRLEDGSTIPKK